MTGRKAAKRANGLYGLWPEAAESNHRPSTRAAPLAGGGAPLDLDECGGRALVRRRLEIGLRLVGRQRYAMDAAPCAAFRAVAHEGARRPSTSFLSRR